MNTLQASIITQLHVLRSDSKTRMAQIKNNPGFGFITVESDLLYEELCVISEMVRHINTLITKFNSGSLENVLGHIEKFLEGLKWYAPDMGCQEQHLRYRARKNVLDELFENEDLRFNPRFKDYAKSL
tara:strand:+ start:281 stop:664 length:384 start_codon:yes stop_codon:yes gene_type:complete